MHDDIDALVLFAAAPVAAGRTHPSGANIIPFPAGAGKRPPGAAQGTLNAAATQALLDKVTNLLPSNCAAHAPTQLAALGALAGFAAQQSLLAAGGADWAQPARNGHLDRLLMSDAAGTSSLWATLRRAAHGMGCNHLPDPQKLLDATLRCVGTTQFGRITLPLEYQLRDQPQASLAVLWPAMADAFGAAAKHPSRWPPLTAECAARRVALDKRQVPVHVALRIVMQAALAMALIEPRLIPGAALKPGGA